MLQDFKDFINRGNVIDLAVAVIMGAAFTPVVDAIVNNVFMQIIAGVFGEPSFDSIGFEVGDAFVSIGSVFTALLNFLIVAVVMFAVIKAYNQFKKKEEEQPTPTAPSEVDLLAEIRDLLRTQAR